MLLGMRSRLDLSSAVLDIVAAAQTGGQVLGYHDLGPSRWRLREETLHALLTCVLRLRHGAPALAGRNRSSP